MLVMWFWILYQVDKSISVKLTHFNSTECPCYKELTVVSFTVMGPRPSWPPFMLQFSQMITFLWACMKTSRILGHKTRLNKFKRVDMIQNTLSDHYGIKLQINNKRKLENSLVCGDSIINFYLTCVSKNKS